ncbi:coproporphyrinogen III oxidase [Gynuella sp.]|uniref:coproporphyrinogen III oxidase n=1 Tax=Gynuella sp. TaxID=2969146 RepID=UPI003D0EC12B
MLRTYSESVTAQRANGLVTSLQQRFVNKLEALDQSHGDKGVFEPFEWLRDGGLYGGGIRYMAPTMGIFNRGSVNVSHVHYSGNPEKSLDSATAISTIIHPISPNAPSVHIHISWTEMKNGEGYWRIMADLNPSNPVEEDRQLFEQRLQAVAGNIYQEGAAQGDKYFYIPALKRHRGVSHFYLEAYRTEDANADYQLARRMGETAIDTYVQILARALDTRPEYSDEARQKQLDYHTLYLFQVLTLDRGTTSGLLVHSQNDIGILASLPARVNKALLSSWRAQMPSPQDELLDAIVAEIPEDPGAEIVDVTKERLAEAVRRHYQKNPQALTMQATGHVVPPTVQNHR